MPLALLLADFQSLPLLPKSKLGLSGADSQVGGFVYVLGSRGSLQHLSCEAASFSCCLNPQRFLQSEVLGLYFPTLESWIVWSVLLPSCSFQFILMQMWDRLVCQPLPCYRSSLPALCVSNPLASLDECFFNSLVVGLPCRSIFWQFWQFFVFCFFF